MDSAKLCPTTTCPHCKQTVESSEPMSVKEFELQMLYMGCRNCDTLIEKQTVRLACCCGEPLSVVQVDGDWVLGHFEKMCGPLIRHADFDAVLKTYSRLKKNDFVGYKTYTKFWA